MKSRVGKAFSYIRFSSKQQVKGDSLRRQLHAAKQYCNHHGLSLDSSSFRDLGVSAYKGDNLHEDSGLGQFLAACSTGNIKEGDYLIVESLDRMSRQHVQTALRQFLNILSHGVTIVTLMDGKSYTQHSDTTDLIISITIMARAYEESATKAKRLKASWSNKRERLQEGTAVLKNTGLAPHWLTLTEDRTDWIVDSDKASLIQLMYEKSAGGYGQHKLVKYLNENNYPAPKGNGWAASSVKRILTDKCVLGHYQPHEFIDGVRTPVGSVLEDYYTPVVSEDLYYQVQAQRKQRTTKNAGKKGEKFTNLLQGIGVCGNCGAKLHMIDKGTKKGGKYLVCSVARKGGDCKYVSYRYEAVERSVLQQLLSEEHYHLLAPEPTNTTDIKNEINRLGIKIEASNNRLRGFLSLVDDFTIVSVKAEYQSQQRAIHELEQGLESARESLAQSSVNKGNVFVVFQLISDITQTTLSTLATPNVVSNDELYALRIKLNSVLSEVMGEVLLSKEFIKQSNQLIHCVSPSFGAWSIQVGRGATPRPLWFLAGWAE